MGYAYYIGMHITYTWGPTGFHCVEDSAFVDECVDGRISRNEVLDLHGINKSAGLCVGVMVAITAFCHFVAYRLMRNDYTNKVRALDAAVETKSEVHVTDAPGASPDGDEKINGVYPKPIMSPAFDLSLNQKPDTINMIAEVTVV